jgi:hypothetical protein
VLALTFLGSLAVCAGAVLALGASTAGDSPRYVESARALLAGQPPTGKAAGYSGFAAVLAGVIALTGDPLAIAWVNALAMALAACAVVFHTHLLFGRVASVAAGVLIVANLELANWTRYVLTDALYTAAVTIAACAVEAASRMRRHSLAAAAACLSAASLRPEGWLLPPIAAVAAAARRSRRLAVMTAASMLALAVFAATRPNVARAVQFETPEQWLARGTVIWATDIWRVEMPPSDRRYSSWQDGLHLALEQPVASARLALARVGAELVHIRPFYSMRHNVAIVLFYAPLFLLAAAGASERFARPGVPFVLVVIAGQLAVVALTFADADGRFLMHVVPLITVLAGGGVARMLARFRPAQPASTLSAARAPTAAAGRPR